LYGRATVTRFLLLALLSCASLGPSACGEASTPTLTHKIVGGSEWRAVLRDWYDGRISEHHSCGAVVVASSHLPVDGPTFSTIAADLARYADRVCTHHPNLDAVELGMSDADVATVAGAPAIPASGRCWDYRSQNRDNTGTAICFKVGRVVSTSQVRHF
jgi:hypothetical protein